ncbi:hypothetical protein ACLESD_18770 [Pyxidicoccus sp. 3LFB2]
MGIADWWRRLRGAHATGEVEAKSRPDPRDPERLAVFDRLPDLLALAIEEQQRTEGADRYVILERLVEEHRERGEPYVKGMPYRHLDRCSECGQTQGAVQYEVADPREGPRVVQVSSRQLHAAREHGAGLPGDFAALLDDLAAR